MISNKQRSRMRKKARRRWRAERRERIARMPCDWRRALTHIAGNIPPRSDTYYAKGEHPIDKLFYRDKPLLGFVPKTRKQGMMVPVVYAKEAV